MEPLDSPLNSSRAQDGSQNGARTGMSCSPSGIAHPQDPHRARLLLPVPPGGGLEHPKGTLSPGKSSCCSCWSFSWSFSCSFSQHWQQGCPGLVKAFGNRVFVLKELFHHVQDAKFTSQILRNPGPSCYSRASLGWGWGCCEWQGFGDVQAGDG